MASEDKQVLISDQQSPGFLRRPKNNWWNLPLDLHFAEWMKWNISLNTCGRLKKPELYQSSFQWKIWFG